ncbi:hypothetical protein TMU01_18290 [Tenuibacillus multivorans]|nr:hypothetical protein TMU01_18290 [Tenuibacillus multivorans]
MEDSQLVSHLKALEETLLLKNKADFERLLAADFMEIGSSGIVYDKQDQLDAFKNVSHSRNWKCLSLSDFDMTRLSEDVAHVTFRVYNEKSDQYSLRSSKNVIKLAHKEKKYDELFRFSEV